jgi:hypothetical protein
VGDAEFDDAGGIGPQRVLDGGGEHGGGPGGVVRGVEGVVGTRVTGLDEAPGEQGHEVVAAPAGLGMSPAERGN